MRTDAMKKSPVMVDTRQSVRSVYLSKAVQQDKAGFYSVGGTATEIQITSNTPELMTITKNDKLGLQFIFKNAGEAETDIRFGDRQVARLKLNIVRLDINEKDPDASVIKAFGLPQKEEKLFTKWPETKSHDSIIYSPSAGQSSISAAHWQWEKFPHLTVSIVDSKVYEIGSNRQGPVEDQLNEIRAWGEMVPEPEKSE